MLNNTVGNVVDMFGRGEFDYLVHGCNCQNVMGSGVAKQIKDRFPNAWHADCKAAMMWPEPMGRLANFSYAIISLKVDDDVKPAAIINAYTQVHYLPRGIDHFDYEAFAVILRKLSVLDPNRSKKFGFPYIGMGLAGGDPERIIPMIEKFAEQHNTTLVEYGEPNDTSISN